MEYIWYYFPISALVNALTSTILGLFLIYKDHRSKVNQHLAYFCLSIAVWGYAYFLWQMAGNAESALYWSRWLMAGTIFAGLTYLHFVLVFLGKEQNYKKLLWFLYALAIFWEAVNFTPYFVSGVEARSLFEFWPIPGPLYIFFLPHFFFGFGYAFWLLWKEFRSTTDTRQMQVGVILGWTFLALLGGATNYFLWFKIPIAPWGNVLVSLYVISSVYAIVKYRFLDITFALKRSITYGLAIFLTFAFWAWFSPFFFPSLANIFQVNFIFSAFVVTLVVAFSLPYLNRFLFKLNSGMQKTPIQKEVERKVNKSLYLICLALLVVGGFFISLSYNKQTHNINSTNERLEQIISINESLNPEETRYQIILISSSLEENFEIGVSLALFYFFIVIILFLLAAYIFFTLKLLVKLPVSFNKESENL